MFPGIKEGEDGFGTGKEQDILPGKSQLQGDADRPSGIAFTEGADGIIDLHLLVLDVDSGIMVFVVGLAETDVVAVEREAGSEAEYMRREVGVVEVCASGETYLVVDIDGLRRPRSDATMQAELKEMIGMRHEREKQYYVKEDASHGIKRFSVQTVSPCW